MPPPLRERIKGHGLNTMKAELHARQRILARLSQLRPGELQRSRPPTPIHLMGVGSSGAHQPRKRPGARRVAPRSPDANARGRFAQERASLPS
jgi:hypothetical protein